MSQPRTIQEFREARCEWCAKGSPKVLWRGTDTMRHKVHTGDVDSFYACTAPSADEIVAELVAKLEALEALEAENVSLKQALADEYPCPKCDEYHGGAKTCEEAAERVRIAQEQTE